MVEEFHNSKYKDKKFKTMSLSIKRLKTQNLNPHADDVVNFVHKDNVSKCLIFSLFYHNVMNQNHNAEAMFPTWKAHVKQDKDGTDSQVSKYFKNSGFIYTREPWSMQTCLMIYQVKRLN